HRSNLERHRQAGRHRFGQNHAQLLSRQGYHGVRPGPGRDAAPQSQLGRKWRKPAGLIPLDAFANMWLSRERTELTRRKTPNVSLRRFRGFQSKLAWRSVALRLSRRLSGHDPAPPRNLSTVNQGPMNAG